MLEETYVLEYTPQVLEDMSSEKRDVFEGWLCKFVISTEQVIATRNIRFYFYREHLLEVVTKWPWLLCSNLGAHFDRCDDDVFNYQSVIQGGPKRYKYP
jgi:hypothetical protein